MAESLQFSECGRIIRPTERTAEGDFVVRIELQQLLHRGVGSSRFALLVVKRDCLLQRVRVLRETTHELARGLAVFGAPAELAVHAGELAEHGRNLRKLIDQRGHVARGFDRAAAFALGGGEREQRLPQARILLLRALAELTSQVARWPSANIGSEATKTAAAARAGPVACSVSATSGSSNTEATSDWSSTSAMAAPK